MAYSSQPNVRRPFSPVAFEANPTERVAHALEFIATALAAIDHNLEVLVERTPKPR